MKSDNTYLHLGELDKLFEEWLEGAYGYQGENLQNEDERYGAETFKDWLKFAKYIQ